MATEPTTHAMPIADTHPDQNPANSSRKKRTNMVKPVKAPQAAGPLLDRARVTKKPRKSKKEVKGNSRGERRRALVDFIVDRVQLPEAWKKELLG
ncbi:hypothetical protein LTR85_004070 [Meristemomyces frigidus]|nr:hypothetical protein LTR85_004070 [Meristemomyces frigidus]